jgi:hypothetical protein
LLVRLLLCILFGAQDRTTWILHLGPLACRASARPQFRVAVCSLVRGLVFQSALISCSSIFAHVVRGLLQEFGLVVFLSYQIKKLEGF